MSRVDKKMLDAHRVPPALRVGLSGHAQLEFMRSRFQAARQHLCPRQMQRSTPLGKKIARGKRAAFTYEPSALPDGTLAGARPGSGNFSLSVKGRSAHAGRNPEEGRNALVAAADLAASRLLDILSSDYVPASLLHAAFLLNQQGLALPEAVRMVTVTPAERVALPDRGEIVPGRRADLLRVRVVEGLPVVRGVWRGGRRIA